MACQIPFEERKTPWRGILDLATGCYPRFLFGGSTSGILPVFHFHDITPQSLEPYLVYLEDNGYQTVTSEAVNSFVLDGIYPGNKKVVLTFDDAWLSLWTVVLPLLRKYGFTAIAFVSPGRVPEAGTVRPTMADKGWSPPAALNIDFASWSELRAINESSIIDLQAHSFSHSVIFCDNLITGFVTPWYNPHIHLRPLMNNMKPYTYVSTDDLGCPLYTQRSRMSDALRFFEPVETRCRCMEFVKNEGGPAFFQKPGWMEILKEIAWAGSGRFETAEERMTALRDELAKSREVLSFQLKGHEVNQMCFQFAVSGRIAESMLKDTGYKTAFADRLFGSRVVKQGNRPYRLMRLKHQFIYCLPGKGRRGLFSSWQNSRKGDSPE